MIVDITKKLQPSMNHKKVTFISASTCKSNLFVVNIQNRKRKCKAQIFARFNLVFVVCTNTHVKTSIKI